MKSTGHRKQTVQKTDHQESRSGKSGKINIRPDITPSLKEGFLASIVILTLVFIIYGRSINYGFVLDDRIVITDNIYTTEGISGIPGLFSKETFEGYFKQKKILVEGGRYRPLSLVTFAMEWSMFAKEKKDINGQPLTDKTGRPVYTGNPHVSHFVNLVMYALTGILIYYLLFILFRPEKGRRWLWNIPFIGALIFILHPVHIEAVANIKGRDEIMAMLGALIALLSSLQYVYARTSREKTLYLFLSGLFFLMGMLSKENAITFLAVIPLTLYFFTRAKTSAHLRAFVPLLIATFIYAVLRIKAVGVTGTGKEITDLINNPFYGMSFPDKFATIFYTLLLYVKLLFYPSPLTIDYWPYHIPWMTWSNLLVILSLILYIAFGLIAWRGFRKKSVISYCILYFIITLLVTSNIFFPVGTFMNERFIYMSSLAFCILVAFFIVKVIPDSLRSVHAKAYLIGALLMVILSAGFIYKTWHRLPDWKDELSLNRSAVTVSGNSARANCFMGVSLFDNVYKPQIDSVKNWQKIPDFKPSASDTLRLLTLMNSIDNYINKAIKIYPSYTSALITKSGIIAEFYKLGKYDEERLLLGYDSLIRTGVDLPFIREFTSYLSTKVQRQLLINDPGIHERAISNAGRLKDFYLRTHEFYSRVRIDKKKSLEYLQLAAQISPNDPAIQEALNRER